MLVKLQQAGEQAVEAFGVAWRSLARPLSTCGLMLRSPLERKEALRQSRSQMPLDHALGTAINTLGQTDG